MEIIRLKKIKVSWYWTWAWNSAINLQESYWNIPVIQSSFSPCQFHGLKQIIPDFFNLDKAESKFKLVSSWLYNMCFTVWAALIPLFLVSMKEMWWGISPLPCGTRHVPQEWSHEHVGIEILEFLFLLVFIL